MWIEILLFIFLGICAVYDGVEREIPLVVVWLGIITAIVLHIQGLGGNGTWQAAALSVIPGAVFWILSFITGEKVGYGDGWLRIMIGLISSSFVVLIMFAARKTSRDYQLPFAPFLLFGMGVVVCL